MQTITTEIKTQPPSKGPRNWTAGLVAAAVVLVLGIAGLTFLTDGGPFAGREPTPVEIAEAYLAARNAYDVEKAQELVSGDFRSSEYPGFNVENMELAFEQHEAYGFEYSEIECSQLGETPDRVVVGCDFLWMTHVQRVANHEATPARITMAIQDGFITVISRGAQPFDDWWDPFDTFLRSEHPDFLEAVDRALSLDPDSVQQIVEELPLYLDLYEEWLNTQDE